MIDGTESNGSPSPARKSTSGGEVRNFQIFISYRRDDAPDAAGRLYDKLDEVFPDNVFMDVDNIPPGVDFVEVVDRAVGECDVLIAVIGKKWLSARDATRRQRRLDLADDFVRLELQAALRRPNVSVIPLLVHGTRMPRPTELPDELKPFARRNAVSVAHANWAADVGSLVRSLQQLAKRKEADEQMGAAQEADLRRAADEAAQEADLRRAADEAAQEADLRRAADKKAKAAQEADLRRAPDKKAKAAQEAEARRAADKKAKAAQEVDLRRAADEAAQETEARRAADEKSRADARRRGSMDAPSQGEVNPNRGRNVAYNIARAVAVVSVVSMFGMSFAGVDDASPSPYAIFMVLFLISLVAAGILSV